MSFLDSYGSAIRSLVVALGGAALAWLWYQDQRILAAAFAGAAVAAGAVLVQVGNSLLPYHPQSAVSFLNFWSLNQSVFGAVAAATVIVVSVELATDSGTPESTKQAISAVSTGVTAFIAALLVEPAGEDKAAGIVKSAIKAAYKREDEKDPEDGDVIYYRFSESKRLERLLRNDAIGPISGWGWKARKWRAKEIQKELSKIKNPQGTNFGSE